jgi:hypothetical protein
MTVAPAGDGIEPHANLGVRTSTTQSAHRAAKKIRFLRILNYGIPGSAPPNCAALAVFQAGVVVLGSFEPCFDGGTAYGRLASTGQPRGTCLKARDGRCRRGPVHSLASHARDQERKLYEKVADNLQKSCDTGSLRKTGERCKLLRCEAESSGESRLSRLVDIIKTLPGGLANFVHR